MIGGIGFIKLAGFFAIFLVIGMLIINVFSAIAYGSKTGDFKPLLTATGGRVLQLDQRMKKSVEFLTDEEAQSRIDPALRLRMVEMMKQQLIFDISILFLVGFLLFKFGNWMAGKAQLDPMTDILIIIIIILLFMGAEMAYTYWITEEIVYPLEGVWTFIKNISTIFTIPDLTIPLVTNATVGG